MAVRRAQASILSGVNSAANGLTLDSSYSRVSAGYIPTSTSAVVQYTSSTTWSRPSNVHWIDIALVGSGGAGACGAGTRTGGGGGGGAVFQVNQFYVGDYDTWYIIIGGGGAGCAGGPQGSCCCNAWGQPGGPTIFSPFNTFNFSVFSGADSSNLRRTLIAPGGAGGGHPCGGIGSWTPATSGGMGSNRETNNHWGVVREDFSGTRIVYSGLGGRGAAGSFNTGASTGFGGGGGGAGGPANQAFGSTPGTNATGGPGKSLASPFSGTYGGGGAGGGSASAGGGTVNVSGSFGTGGGGGGAQNTSGAVPLGGSGRIEIRQWFSS